MTDRSSCASEGETENSRRVGNEDGATAQMATSPAANRRFYIEHRDRLLAVVRDPSYQYALRVARLIAIALAGAVLCALTADQFRSEYALICTSSSHHESGFFTFLDALVP